MTANDGNLNNSLYSSTESSSSLKVDSDQWMGKADDDQLVPSATEQSSTCSGSQLNSSGQLSVHNINIDDNSEKQLNSSQKYDSNEVGNFSGTQGNDQQQSSSVVPTVKFRKPPKTTISIQVDIVICVT